ncbi:MAG: decaprenyl-phosphate phosphoribosyltransferase [Candidatus Aminicenantes bacterium]|nr:MAG: decaprenyl-phosphate phosphoribosyltransferase [Candidatus Aminicenantes bacterium]
MILEVVKSLRIQQWIKNLWVFAPLIFSQNVFDLSLLIKTILAFVLFCIISGAAYILNDIQDLEEDKIHPYKSKRPLASGRLKKNHALFACLLLVLLGLTGAYFLNIYFFVALLVYSVLQVAYSSWLKHVVIIDVFLIATGFFLRVIAGGLAIEVQISPWLFICTILIALFLALSKRRHELVLLDKSAEIHRPILKEYTPHLLDQMIAVVTASTVISYCLYTVSSETIAKFGTTNMLFTVPFVLYGIFRYLYLVHQKDEGGSPEALIIKDKPLLVDLFLWIATAMLILYI